MQAFDLSGLTESQVVATTGLLEFLNPDSNEGMALLIGSAGTGKTYTMAAVIQTLLAHVSGVNIAMSATTNKAVRQMRKAATYESSAIHYATVHSLLGLKPHRGNNGEISFLPDKNTQPKLAEYNIMILDEVSMLNDELFDRLPPFVRDYGLKIIFVGDLAQIPPVRSKGTVGDVAKPLLSDTQKKHNIKVFSLTEVVRQAAGSPIIQYATHQRENLDSNRMITQTVGFESSRILENGDGVLILRDDRQAVLRLLKEWFTSEQYKADPDYCRVIAWTNSTVEAMNRIIRTFIYGQGAPAYCIGERLVADAPILAPDDATIILYTNNEEVEIESLEDRQENFRPSLSFNLTVHLKYHWAVVSNGSRREYVRLIHEDSQQEYNAALQSLADAAQEAAKSNNGANYWRAYFSFRDKFAQLNYAYAGTVHKSQGSTFNRVMVMEQDIQANPRRKERNSIKYTAFTRPTSMLVIPC